MVQEASSTMVEKARAATRAWPVVRRLMARLDLPVMLAGGTPLEGSPASILLFGRTEKTRPHRDQQHQPNVAQLFAHTLEASRAPWSHDLLPRSMITSALLPPRQQDRYRVKHNCAGRRRSVAPRASSGAGPTRPRTTLHDMERGSALADGMGDATPPKAALD